jgi:hypothetical protein
MVLSPLDLQRQEVPGRISMSTQTQALKPKVPEGWRPKRREQGGLRQVRREGDGQYTFKGKEKDEEVKLIVRQHLLFLLRPALPVLLVLLGFVFNSLLITHFHSFYQFWALIFLFLVVALFIALGYFLWKDFLIWWVNIDIITNKRIISCRGFLQPSRKITTLDKIVQVSIDQDSLLSILLAYGNVHIYLVGGQQVLKDVPKPREIRDAVQGIFQEFKASRPPAEKPIQLANPEMTALIGKLGKKEAVPTLPNADERYAHRQNLSKLRRPLRRFGGPLRIPAEVTYASDEQTVMYIQRSKWLLISQLMLPGLVLLVALTLTFVLSIYAALMIGIALAALLVMGLITINYVDDVFILTNKRVIDIERKFVIFFEARVEAEYKNIRDTRVKITNIFQNMFDVGSVYVETPGNNPDINMTLIDHPFFIADKINQIKSFSDKVKGAKDKNARQEELAKWFTNVVAVLEKKMVSRGVPNLQTLDLWTATEMAAEAGMKVVPVGEDDSYPQIQPGRIVSQDPIPGTLIAMDPDKAEDTPHIRVTLSKHS